MVTHYRRVSQCQLFLGLLKFDIAGSYITNELLKCIDSRVPIIPHYKFIKNKIEDQFFSEYLPHVKDDPSYEAFWKREIVRDMKECMLAVSEDSNNKYLY